MLGDYNCLEKAYKYFNEKLFDGKLPEVYITLQRRPNSRGYYAHERFIMRGGKKLASELALNPDTFADREDIEILSTLAHEMVHVEECNFGELPRKGYHTKVWASLMEDIGLMPSATGEPGGKKTGQNMTHYIIPNGKFEKVAGAFLLNNKLEWQSIPLTEKEKSAKKKSSRAKYTCPDCGTNAWAKQDALLDCGACHVQMEKEEE